MNSGKRWLKNITGVALVLLFAVTVILTGCNNQNAKAEEPSSSASGATEISSEALSEETKAGTEKDITDGRTDTEEVSENHEKESEEEDEAAEENEAVEENKPEEEEEAAEENEPEEEDETAEEEKEIEENEPAEEGEEIEKTMHLYVNDEELAVLWEANESVDALRKLVSKESLTIELSMYGGFEQVGPIGQELPGNDIQMITSAGDIVLYNGDQIVVFFGSNTWSYTKLGHVENMTEELAKMLGQEHVLLKVNMDE